MVLGGHAVPAATADRESLEEGWTFAGWTPAILTVGTGVLAQALDVLLVLHPRDIAFVDVRDQDLPLLLRKHLDPDPAVRLPSCPAPAVGEGPRVTGIVQSPHRP
jgi:hypothetical protein